MRWGVHMQFLSVDLNYVGVIIGDDIDISEDGKLIPNRDSFYDIMVKL